LRESGDLEHCAHVEVGCVAGVAVDDEDSGAVVLVLEVAVALLGSDGSAMVGKQMYLNTGISDQIANCDSLREELVEINVGFELSFRR
jgi:hypothetical protein